MNKNHIISKREIPNGNWRNTIEDLSEQIIQDWCFVHFCSMTRKEEMKQHCKDHELRIHLIKCAGIKFEASNTIDERTKVLNKIWNDRDFDSNENTIRLVVCIKFLKENIDIHCEEFDLCIHNFLNHYQKLISIIANDDANEIDAYINQL